MKRFQSKVQDLILGIFTQIPQQETDDLSRSRLNEGRIDMSTEPEYQQDGDDKDLQLNGFTCRKFHSGLGFPRHEDIDRGRDRLLYRMGR